MSRGRSNKLVGQTGEYLVAAELGRRGLIATTFTGNVPHYDIIASNATGQHVVVQVKTSRSSSWQLSSIEPFCNITLKPNTKQQVVGSLKPSPIKGLIFVFVHLGAQHNDRFYILRGTQLGRILRQHHSEFLARYNGTRPKRWDSMHTAINATQLAPFLDNWKLIESKLA
jgi:hypothetical protein